MGLLSRWLDRLRPVVRITELHPERIPEPRVMWTRKWVEHPNGGRIDYWYWWDDLPGGSLFPHGVEVQRWVR